MSFGLLHFVGNYLGELVDIFFNALLQNNGSILDLYLESLETGSKS